MSKNRYFIRKMVLAAAMVSVLQLTACSAIPEKQVGELPALHSVESVVSEDVTYAIDVYDPFEGFNRGMYRFNAGFDHYIFLPVVGAYESVMPGFAEKGVSNFFNNLFEITNLTNSILQLKPKATIATTERIIVNTTIGVVGLFDVATTMGIYEHEEDFGQTLGHYGVGSGPFIVLPILGPSNLRDTTGTIVDSVTMASIDPLNLDEHSERELVFYLLNAIDDRHTTAFRYYDSGSPFEYELIRKLYTEKRKLDIKR